MNHPLSQQLVTVTTQMNDIQGNPVTVQLTEKQATHLMEECARVFGWSAVKNPFTEPFLKTFIASLEVAEKVEGGG